MSQLFREIQPGGRWIEKWLIKTLLLFPLLASHTRMHYSWIQLSMLPHLRPEQLWCGSQVVVCGLLDNEHVSMYGWLTDWRRVAPSIPFILL